MRKSLFLVVLFVLLLTLPGFGFEKGNKSIGGTAAYQTYKFSDDAPLSKSFHVAPRFSYFVTRNLSLDVSPGLSVSWSSWDNPYSGTVEKETYTGVDLAVGFRYFHGMFYGGANYSYHRGGPKGRKSSQQYLRLSVGRLFGVSGNLYLDLGVDYTLGIGKITNTYGPYEGLTDIENDSRHFSTRVGFVVILD